MIQSLFRWKDKKTSKKEGGVTYYDLKVREIIRETEDAITIIFENPGEKINYRAGQYLTLIMKIDGEEVRRSYSLSSSPVTDDHLAVTVKKVDGGSVSHYINHELKPGDSIRIMQPMGKFTTDFESKNERTFLLFAGGSGITPLISITKTALASEPRSKVFLVYQNRNIGSVIFRNQIDSLMNKYPDRFRVIHVLSKPEKSWQGRSGRITAEMVKNIVSESQFDIHSADVFFCGPAGMMDTAEMVMEELGVDRSRFYKESFVSTPSKSGQSIEIKDALNDTSRVYLQIDGEEHMVTVKKNEFILETALDHDIDVPFSCQSGLCTTCRGKLISGQVRMEDPDGLSEDEIEQGYVLTCVSHPDSDEVRIEIG